MKYKKVLFSLLQAVIIIFLVAVALLSFSSRIPLLANRGLQFFAVISGSMEPKIPTGSLVHVGKFKLDELKKDDIITFLKKDEKSGRTFIVTHRIQDYQKVEVIMFDQNKKPVKSFQYIIKTKGDANNAVDEGQVMPNEILGKYKWHVPQLGKITLFAQQPTGFFLFIVLPAVILIMWEIFSLINHFRMHYKEQARKEIEKMKAEMKNSK